MKKCASCTKDLPDAALHCVFCGAKQPPAPATAQGLAKTVMGAYSASDMMDQLRHAGPGGAVPRPSGTPPAASPSPPPSPAPPAAAASAHAGQAATAATAFQVPPRPPQAPGAGAPIGGAGPAPLGGYSAPGLGHAATPGLARPGAPPGPTLVAPQSPGPGQAPSPIAGPPLGGLAPTPASVAPTMFVAPAAGPPAGNFSGSAPGPLPPPGPYAAGYPSSPQQPGAPYSVPQPQPAYAPQPQPAYAPQPQPAYAPQPQPAYAPQPQSRPPYLAAIAQSGRPIEPWRERTRLMMFLWGGALLVAFAVPLTLDPLSFQWSVILEAPGRAKVAPLLVAAVGLLSVVLALIPMGAAARGALAAVLGLAGVVVPLALAGMPPWKLLVPLAGMILLLTALLVRDEYRESMVARLLVTVAVIALLVPYVVPERGAVPLLEIFKQLIEAPGRSKVFPALAVGYVVVVMLTLLAWMPAPATGGAKVFAWILMLWPALLSITALAVTDRLVDVASKTPAGLVAWIGGIGADGGAGEALAAVGAGLGVAYAVLISYGLASVIGKRLE